MSTQMKLSGRVAGITNAFIHSIIPVLPPSADEVRQALDILGMTPETLQCAFCGGFACEWDHLRPLVKNRRPSGYISEIHNLVPSCSKCNQSKGNREWKDWMASAAALSPTARGVQDVAERIRRLEAYENWCAPVKLDYEAIVGKDVWTQHWQNLERVQSLLSESQDLAEEINRRAARAFGQVTTLRQGVIPKPVIER